MTETTTHPEPATATATAADELEWMPAWRAAELIRTDQLSSTELVEHMLARIARLDPVLHAFSHLDADAARTAAKRADEAVRSGRPLGLLHGVPTAVKDHIPVAGMPLNSHGKGERTTVDGHFGVERLRAEGAIIVGLNSMMGAGGGARLQSAAVFAPFNWDAEARNPWDTARTPGWSSSGGAAAVASGLLPFAIGSDGGGSTRLPAAYSGVVGVHPTGGLIPELDYTKVIPPAGITVGPLARDVRDAALVTQVMAGPDGRDPFCIQDDPADYLAGIDDGVRGMRFAWTDDYGFAARYAADESDEVIAHARAAAAGFASLGATVETTDQQWEDFWPGRMAQWMAIYRTEGLDMPGEDDMRAGFETRGRNWERFRTLFRSFDLLLSVTSQRLAAPIPEWEAAWTSAGPSYPNGNFLGCYCSHTDMFNWLKFPAVSVPCGFVRGLPVGLQIVGPPRSEARIFRAALAFQKAFPQSTRPPLA